MTDDLPPNLVGLKIGPKSQTALGPRAKKYAFVYWNTTVVANISHPGKGQGIRSHKYLGGPCTIIWFRHWAEGGPPKAKNWVTALELMDAHCRATAARHPELNQFWRPDMTDGFRNGHRRRVPLKVRPPLRSGIQPEPGERFLESAVFWFALVAVGVAAMLAEHA